VRAPTLRAPTLRTTLYIPLPWPKQTTKLFLFLKVKDPEMPFDVRSILTSPNSTQKVSPIESQEPLSISGIALHLLQFLVIGLVFWLRDVANTVYTAGLKLLSIFLQYLYSCGTYLDRDFAARWGPEANLQAWFWCGDELPLNGISRKNALIPKTAPMSSPAFEISSPDREFDSNCDKHGALFTSSMSHTSFFGRLQENTISSPVKNAFVDARPLPSLPHDAYEPRASATVKTRAVVKRRTFPRAPATLDQRKLFLRWKRIAARKEKSCFTSQKMAMTPESMEAPKSEHSTISKGSQECEASSPPSPEGTKDMPEAQPESSQAPNSDTGAKESQPMGKRMRIKRMFKK